MPHTPGPWTLQECSNGGALLCRGEQHQRWTHPQSMLQVLPIEDARLIAAAPELLEALKGMLWLANDHEWEENDTPEILAAKAIIAKAEGRVG